LFQIERGGIFLFGLNELDCCDAKSPDKVFLLFLRQQTSVNALKFKQDSGAAGKILLKKISTRSTKKLFSGRRRTD
jgi:hypothetical protein